MVMVNMERYRSHELRVAIYITKIRARKFHVKYMRLTFSRQKYLYGKITSENVTKNFLTKINAKIFFVKYMRLLFFMGENSA